MRRWLAERPDLAPDEFVDDIPFPETQDYVRKILGTAENYRRIYGGESRLPSDPDRAVPSLAARRAPASVAPSPHVSGRPPAATTVARSGVAKKAAADAATKPGSQPGASKRSFVWRVDDESVRHPQEVIAFAAGRTRLHECGVGGPRRWEAGAVSVGRGSARFASFIARPCRES